MSKGVNNKRGDPGAEIAPNTTQTPNIYFDKLFYLLEESELRTLLYAVRRTMGFHKQSDNISLSQFMNGNGRQDKQGNLVEHGTGLSRETQIRTLERLVAFGILVKVSENAGNSGAEWALQLDEEQIDFDALTTRYEAGKRQGRRRTHAGRQKAAEAIRAKRAAQQPDNDPKSDEVVYPIDQEGGLMDRPQGSLTDRPQGSLMVRPEVVYPIDQRWSNGWTHRNKDRNKDRNKGGNKERAHDDSYFDPMATGEGNAPPRPIHPDVPWPDSAEQENLASHPATWAWMDANLAWPGYDNIGFVVNWLGESPNPNALKRARELWKVNGYREANIMGILEWYSEIAKNKDWLPSDRFKEARTNGNGRHPPAKTYPADYWKKMTPEEADRLNREELNAHLS